MSHSHIKALNDRVAGLIAERDELRASNAELREAGSIIKSFVCPMGLSDVGADSPYDRYSAALKHWEAALAKTTADTGRGDLAVIARTALRALGRIRTERLAARGLCDEATAISEARHMLNQSERANEADTGGELKKRDGEYIAHLRKDKARLDWLENSKTGIGYNVECCGWGVDFEAPHKRTIRGAIDAGMAISAKGKATQS